MRRKKASDFDPRILELYDGYVHGKLSRREFIDRAATITVGTAAAATMLESLQPNYALALQVPPDDRSEEHTSELQSLMRISYAVFCLKKQNIITIDTNTEYIHNSST